MQHADRSANASGGLQLHPDGRGLRVGIVQARFNAALTDRLAFSCIAELHRLGVAAEGIEHVTVPGALEVALALDALARRGARGRGLHALIALGCIVRGETYHFELVANESGAAVTRVGLEHRLPVANAILTVENEAQAWARADEKGRDAARVAIEMANLMAHLA